MMISFICVNNHSFADIANLLQGYKSRIVALARTVWSKKACAKFKLVGSWEKFKIVIELIPLAPAAHSRRLVVGGGSGFCKMQNGVVHARVEQVNLGAEVNPLHARGLQE